MAASGRKDEIEASLENFSRVSSSTRQHQFLMIFLFVSFERFHEPNEWFVLKRWLVNLWRSPHMRQMPYPSEHSTRVEQAPID
ncbi:hypothetical protein RvY_11584 [Ramazzottius varieornatus]|uniref:Uncharacterized protein n=1 Tax=Ramazzottius varieornatus TaxID=947166 RepID=A0A1D1VPC6_RAMVA|nr:hypothetical protein RvY_11584 [Ramazzottius varieornatus]